MVGPVMVPVGRLDLKAVPLFGCRLLPLDGFHRILLFRIATDGSRLGGRERFWRFQSVAWGRLEPEEVRDHWRNMAERGEGASEASAASGVAEALEGTAPSTRAEGDGGGNPGPHQGPGGELDLGRRNLQVHPNMLFWGTLPQSPPSLSVGLLLALPSGTSARPPTNSIKPPGFMVTFSGPQAPPRERSSISMVTAHVLE
ncbi:hypothetical protein AAG570_006021 [Ranatra chinensis]|uniref:Uncharacterized protein n=1 Tax=Ranatra chinensis TaxID=642074 RepID=A0ABD0XWT8_9HEMI